MAEYKNKKLALIGFLGIAVAVIIVMGLIATLVGSSSTQDTYKGNSQIEIISKNGTTAYEIVEGTYVAGKDFDSGIYNIIAINGSGSISSDNMYTGGIDGEISSSGNGSYKEYRDISIPNDAKLTINGDVKIELIKVNE